MIGLVGVIHLVESTIDVLKQIQNLSFISYKDLYAALKAESIKMNSQVNVSTIDKSIQISNYYLLNKIYLTRYDLDSINEFSQTKTPIDYAQVPLPIKSAKPTTPLVKPRVTFEDKSTETEQLIEEHELPARLKSIILDPEPLLPLIQHEVKYEDKSTETIQEPKVSSKLVNDLQLMLSKPGSSLSIQTYKTFLESPTPRARTSSKHNETTILETPPSILELLYLDQIRKKNLEKE